MTIAMWILIYVLGVYASYVASMTYFVYDFPYLLEAEGLEKRKSDCRMMNLPICLGSWISFLVFQFCNWSWFKRDDRKMWWNYPIIWY